jgi:hypothetical protein
VQTGGTVRLSIYAAIAFLAASLPAQAALLIDIDKSSQQMTVSRDGQTLYTWPVSTGGGGYDTPSGTFKPNRMDADHHSDEYDAAPMPYAIFFDNQGHAIHGSYEKRSIGSPASHGCVRLNTKNAATLFALVKQEKMANTRVVIGGNMAIAARRAPGKRETVGGTGARDSASSQVVTRDLAPPTDLRPPASRRETVMAPVTRMSRQPLISDDDSYDFTEGFDDELPPVRMQRSAQGYPGSSREREIVTWPLPAPHYHDRYRYYHRYD